MRAEEKLRDALEQIESYADVQAEQRLIGRGAWEWVAFRAQQALAEAGESEMMQLLRWCKKEQKICAWGEEGDLVMAQVIRQIRKFGYSLEEQ